MEKLHMCNLDLNSDLHICLVGRSQSEDQPSWQEFVVFLRLSRQKLGWCLKLGLRCFPPHCFIVFNLWFGNHPIIWHHRAVYSGKSFVNVWLGYEGMVFSYHLHSCKIAYIGKLYFLPIAVWFLNLSSVTIFCYAISHGFTSDHPII